MEELPTKEPEPAAADSLTRSVENLSIVPDLESGGNDLSDLESDLEVDESLASTIIQEIIDGTYTCLVCTCEIDHTSKIWSCDQCYRVYDLDCIKDWAVRGSSTKNKEWRCPSCNVGHRKIPSRFTCWCGRTTNPKLDSLIPFSCGNGCDARYPNCIHSCLLVCHPGAHPVCGAMGPLMKCDCGKHERQLPCIITLYDGWLCEDACDVELCDDGHRCNRACHEGFCGPCLEQVLAKCYCGQSVVEVRCSDQIPKQCAGFVGTTSCGDKSTVYYDCGEHFEELECQPLPLKAPACKYSPDVVKTCYCGKTAGDASRTSCTDPMPECDSVCGKKLKCGCTCLAKCHAGECICYNVLQAKCSCQNYSYLVPCSFLQQGNTPRCTHKCPVLLSCRRHYHKEVCCPDEQAALRRERDRKKQLRNNSRSTVDDLMTIEPAHICTRTCGRLKACGIHYCEALCHQGPCGVCLESTSDDLACPCGRTVIPAPVRCGTVIDCRYPCTRPKPCGHPPEPHECHADDKPCPKCTRFVTKKCVCGSKEFPNVLCSRDNVSCGRICTTAKECGHPCQLVCSKQCIEGVHDDVANCASMCRKKRTSCPHMCKLKCHHTKKGTCDSITCREQVEVLCGCGHHTKKVACGANEITSSTIGVSFECDEECAKKKRDDELKAAFADEPEFVNPYPADVSSVYVRQKAWCRKIELFLRDFVSDYTDLVAANAEAKKFHHFPPFSKPQRDFVRNLALVFGLYADCQDKEPQRAVYVMMTDRTKVPELTILSALEIEEQLALQKAREQEIKVMELQDAYFNAILIKDVFFGITKEDIETRTTAILESFSHPVPEPEVKWISESTYVFFSRLEFTDMDVERENKLYMLMKTFRKLLRDELVAFDCKLCMVDEVAETVLKIDDKNIVLEKAEIQEKKSANAFDVLSE